MEVQLQFEPTGTGSRGTVTATADGDVIHSDTGDIHDADFRRSFISELCKKCQALDSDDLERELLHLTPQPVRGVGKRASIAHDTLTPLPDYEPFPVDVLPPVLGEFVRKSTDAIGCDESYVAVPLLPAIASAIGNTCRIKLKESWCEPSVLWAVIVGESGTRKSPALELVTKPVILRQDKATKAHELAMRDYKVAKFRHEAELKQWKHNKAVGKPPEEPEEPVLERFLCMDTTIEALADRLLCAPRGLLVAPDELAGWLGGFDQYKSGRGADAAHWLEVHGARALIVDRKTGDRKVIYVPRAAVSVTGGIQPHVLARCLTRDYFESGVAARLLLAMPPRRISKWTNSDIPTELSSGLESLFDHLYSLSFVTDAVDQKEVPVDLILKPDALKVWIEFYDAHAEETAQLSGDLAAAWSKLEGYAARLALVLQLVKNVGVKERFTDRNRIDAESIRSGVTLARWFGKEARRVYQVLNESDDVREQRRLIDLIRRNGGTMTARDLSRKSSQFRTSDEAEAALRTLADAGLGTWTPQKKKPGGGRPTHVFTLQDDTYPDETPRHGAENRGFVKEGFVEPGKKPVKVRRRKKHRN